MTRLGTALLMVLFGLTLLNACSKTETEDDLMKSGLDALYTRNDPATAADQFRKVLEKNPTHYGATYQVAVALERVGKRDEARRYWEKMLTMAEASRDEKTANTARARLGRAVHSDPQGEPMKAGLEALYTRKDPEAAATQFRKVLEANPAHYGATYQLAVALDQAGKPAEARPLWEKVLKMAETSKDTQTATTARTRLARKP